MKRLNCITSLQTYKSYPATWPPTYQGRQSSSKVKSSSVSQYSVDICGTTRSWSALHKRIYFNITFWAATQQRFLGKRLPVKQNLDACFCKIFVIVKITPNINVIVRLQGKVAPTPFLTCSLLPIKCNFQCNINQLKSQLGLDLNQTFLKYRLAWVWFKS